MDICRAITFINFHIPVVLDQNVEIPYSTVGFFDGMQTEFLEIHRDKEEMKQLWEYGLKLTSKSKGQYSYQNIFCFSKDEWNDYQDSYFWADDTNQEYPLTFVVFLQLRKYRNGKDAIKNQCQTFNSVIKSFLENQGIYYSYCTIDKNDFVVCLKCRDYKNAVKTIKSLHDTGVEVIYSYSVFSVLNSILKELNAEKYNYLFEQEIDSICLKGISNSYDPQHNVTLDQKYMNFCKELVHLLYQGKEGDPDVDFKIYDILGDDDFRLIARFVNLGILLQQYAPGGLLCCKEKDFQFYFFSSNLVFNTLAPLSHSNTKINKSTYQSDMIKKMKKKFQSPLCDELQNSMCGISKILSLDADVSFSATEKKRAFCHAIWQLLQSLKALERAPTKKYDFWSLYNPLSVMVNILEEKMNQGKMEEHDEISQNTEIYDFIHKISMTLHGTLRTDIQFFQIRDFNVIVHYAPAKLRAFYALWALQLSDFYNAFNDYNANQYSFICCPGMFRSTCVKPLFDKYKENSRLMLIMVPERHLYAPKRLSHVLAHEVSHFVGYQFRNRPLRHQVWLKCCVRVLFLEMSHFRYQSIVGDDQKLMEQWLKDSKLYFELTNQLIEENEVLQKKYNKTLWPHMFHSRNSFKLIEKAFAKVAEKNYIEKFVLDDCNRMTEFFINEKGIKHMRPEEKIPCLKEIKEAFTNNSSDLLTLYARFQSRPLSNLLNVFRYITTEAYADLIAILTLNLTPRDYILSFCEGEFNIDIEENDVQEGILLCVRAGITINAICHVMKSRPEQYERTRFLAEWSKDVPRELSINAAANSSEQWLALNIYSYTSHLRVCNENISDYCSIYNDTEQLFINKELDCFNDQIVWNLIEQYMNTCAEDYISILSEHKNLQVERKKFVRIYENITKGSATDLAQEIENFLEQFEKTMKQI